MLSSAPFDVYCIMIVVALLGLPLPEALISRNELCRQCQRILGNAHDWYDV